MQRRQFLSALPLAAAALSATGTTSFAQGSPRPVPRDPRLRFNRDGRFRILVYSDLHYGPEPDTASQAMIADMIKTEKPDFIIINGDTISGEFCKTQAEVRETVAQVAAPPEAAGLPWAVTMGNHDRNQAQNTSLSDEAFFSLYEAWPHNLNGNWETGITGIGNKNLLIWDAEGSKPAFNLWLLDSGKPSANPALHYDWVQPDQIDWFLDGEAALEERFGPLSSLMFFHIPVREFSELSASGKITGMHKQHEGSSAINSGLFAALLQRRNVLGMFCGHDHLNSYIGQLHGITLGFDGSAGFKHAYPKMPVDDPRNEKLRSGRIFEITSGDPVTVRTWLHHKDGSRDGETSLSRTGTDGEPAVSYG